MKKYILLLIMVWSVSGGYAQNEQEGEIQTLFSGQRSLGFYGALSLGYSRINNQDALVSGGRLAMIFNHSTAVGLAGYGFVNNLDEYRWYNEDVLSYSLAGGYGGIFIEPIIGGLKPVHVAFPVVFGLGGIGQVRNHWSGPWDAPYYDMPETDLFFIVEPGVELEFNLARFFRAAAAMSYRYTSNIELVGVDPEVLNGLMFGLTFKFGKF